MTAVGPAFWWGFFDAQNDGKDYTIINIWEWETLTNVKRKMGNLVANE